jgi:thymidine phosphorylase
MLSSTKLKEIVAEARPVIERMLDDAELIKGFREVVTANGGEWSSLKALLKAQVEDERDDAGDGKRVRKILDKADFAAAYADMLGLNLNEENKNSEAA